jgi:hypothetical protein
MPYAILRFQKCKAGGVTARGAHNERSKEAYKSNPDIDPKRRQDNYHLIQPKQTYRREVARMITAAGCRTRKDSTVMVETLITASPEFMAALPPPEQREYFTRALAFIESRIGRDNIIAAVVHRDETTPHMHLSFCPITPDKKLSAKAILGNQAQLSRWQTDYHAAMSERWPELERGISAQITKRKNLPAWLFKLAARLDKQAAGIEAALAGINPLNAKKQRDKAIGLFREWLPQAVRFTAQAKTVDGHIESLERAAQEAQKQAQTARDAADQRVGNAVARMQTKLDGKDKEIQEALQKARELQKQIRNAETMIFSIPTGVREKYLPKQKNDKERGKPR